MRVSPVILSLSMSFTEDVLTSITRCFIFSSYDDYISTDSICIRVTGQKKNRGAAAPRRILYDFYVIRSVSRSKASMRASESVMHASEPMMRASEHASRTEAGTRAERTMMTKRTMVTEQAMMMDPECRSPEWSSEGSCEQ